MNWPELIELLETVLDRPINDFSTQALHGGDINASFRLRCDEDSFFVKLNRKELLAMFESEAQGLRELAATQTVKIPRPLLTGLAGGQAFLVTEYLTLTRRSARADRLLGQQLALLHRQPQAFFGWHIDNTIGRTPQINTPSDDWQAFWRDQRLGYQLELAARHGYTGQLQRLGERLRVALHGLFEGYSPRPSLVHGDLWSGNAASDSDGQPVIFDPACHYGDRETDLAMTELFGGYSREFYDAYNETWPLDPGYTQRRDLYQLYHVLNHLNLFGGGYQHQAEHLMQRLLAIL